MNYGNHRDGLPRKIEEVSRRAAENEGNLFIDQIGRDHRRKDGVKHKSTKLRRLRELFRYYKTAIADY